MGHLIEKRADGLYSCTCGFVALTSDATRAHLELIGESAQVAKHVAPPTTRPTTWHLLDQALTLLGEANDRFLPAHTREHVLAARDLIQIARMEIVGDHDDAPCRLKIS
jgi:hypothetical protein